MSQYTSSDSRSHVTSAFLTHTHIQVWLGLSQCVCAHEPVRVANLYSQMNLIGPMRCRLPTNFPCRRCPDSISVCIISTFTWENPPRNQHACWNPARCKTDLDDVSGMTGDCQSANHYVFLSVCSAGWWHTTRLDQHPLRWRSAPWAKQWNILGWKEKKKNLPGTFFEYFMTQ